MQASSRFRKLHLFSIVFLLVFLLILSSFSTARAQNGLCEQPMSSSTAGHPVQTSLAKSDPLHAAQPSGPLDPQAQAAVDAALASLEGNSSLSGSLDPTNTSVELWQSRSNAPSARGTHALAYDAFAEKVILFGGFDGSDLNDTWAYDYATNTWTNCNPANPPPVRRDVALVYDDWRGKVILFGGWDAGYLNDTWAYDYVTNTWTNRNPANPPPARSTALTYDTSVGLTVLFGGQGSTSKLNDTWTYNYASNTWTNRNPANPPLARYQHALAYDASAAKVILFGGYNLGFFNDTWAYDYVTNTWTNRNPVNPPPARSGHALAYDGKVFLFGGFIGSSSYLNDTWTYNYATNDWTNRNVINPPSARGNYALAYDASAGKVILFGGGDNSSYFNDTWACSSIAILWTHRNSSPFARSGHALAYDASAGKVILFGGLGIYGNLSDTWAYDYASNIWTRRTLSSPPARVYHALAYDAAAGKVILFGGWNGSSDLNDTWAYDYATNTWTNRNPANPPSVRNGHALAYDDAAAKVMLFGGWSNSYGGSLNDTWAYDYATNTWTNRNPANPPSVRNGHALAYDASAGKVILFGGYGGGFLNDIWAYNYATNTWTNRNPANPPSARSGHALAYNAVAVPWNTTILFGGQDDSGSLNDTWAYDYSTNGWTECGTLTTHPPARTYHALAYDAAAGKVILFGGYGSDYLNDTWALTLGSVSQTLNYSLTEGWNMISVPVTPTSTDPSVVFGALPSPWYLFEWDPLAGTYIGKELISLRLGTGYWLKVPTAVNYPVSGLQNGEAQTGIELGLGWNLIGVPYQGTIPWGAVRVSRDGWVFWVTLDQAVTSNWIQGMFFHWNGSTYDMLTSGGSFHPLFGYWVKAKVAGLQLVFLQP